MRKIDQECSQAFYDNKHYLNGNTEVLISGNVALLRLYGNLISYKTDHENVMITTQGYNTQTTLARLNAIIKQYYFFRKLTSKQGKLYINGFEWTGETINLHTLIYNSENQ